MLRLRGGGGHLPSYGPWPLNEVEQGIWYGWLRTTLVVRLGRYRSCGFSDTLDQLTRDTDPDDTVDWES